MNRKKKQPKTSSSSEKKDAPQVWIVIPAYNEAPMIDRTVKEVLGAGYRNIVVVDDGSTDGTAEKLGDFPEGVIVLRHKINRGKGAATKTGIEAAKLLGADIIVTMDADGQHDPRNIPALIEPIVAGRAETVLGSRFLRRPKDMPTIKIFYNKLGNFLTWALFGLWVTDSQSGLRAYSRHAAELIDTRYDRYEYESEVIHEIRHHNLYYEEVPISIRYTEYSMNKEHKQNLINGIKTVYKMIFKLIQ